MFKMFFMFHYNSPPNNPNPPPRAAPNPAPDKAPPAAVPNAFFCTLVCADVVGNPEAIGVTIFEYLASDS
jgi:hypothetical protein